jgi:glutamate N-acetyltransferase / amino-acid N-acetyltransferase
MTKDTNNTISGFSFSAVAAGVKNPETDRLDMALIASDVPATTAGMTTTNLVCAAPVAMTRKCLERGICRAVLINSGNANAYTGERGLKDAEVLVKAAAGELGAHMDQIVPMSTGVIGNPLPVDRMLARMPELVEGLSPHRLGDVASAIMTTDTVPKTVCTEREFSSGPVRMLGVAKGSGMIAPNMATMLAVIMTDVAVEPPFLQESLKSACAGSFNRITVDGDTSTNDTVVVMAGGKEGSPKLSDRGPDGPEFASMLEDICRDLARRLVRDGEGTTKVVEIRAIGAPDKESAKIVARTIAESPLVKTAFNGEDPNWGRIICAAGRAGVLFDPDKIDLLIGDVPIVTGGTIEPGDWESRAHAVMKSKEFVVTLDLKAGSAQAAFLTTDLSAEYVRINADYRS